MISGLFGCPSVGGVDVEELLGRRERGEGRGGGEKGGDSDSDSNN